MHWNTKKRQDDKRGYKVWTEESKQKVRLWSTKHPLLQDEQWLRKQYVELKRTTVDIAKELGCVNSTVFCALNRKSIPRRNRKEAVSKGSKHYLWNGGTSLTKRDTKSSAYRVWRMNVFVRDGFTCQICGAKKPLQAHHVLSYKDFPDLVFRVDNGITLCKPCHYKLHGRKSIIKGGELLGSPERVISSQAKVGIPLKVQRLEDEARTAGNFSTSAIRESEDIVRS
jgi:hypothetical protein